VECTEHDRFIQETYRTWLKPTGKDRLKQGAEIYRTRQVQTTG